MGRSGGKRFVKTRAVCAARASACWLRTSVLFNFFEDPLSLSPSYAQPPNSSGIRLHGRCIDHSWTVAAHYARHGLSFDVFTSIPVSWMELADWQACQRVTAKVDFDGETGGMEKLPGPTLRMIRFMKPFRWFKIARILKMSRMRAWTRTRRTEWCAFTRCVFTL